MGTDPLAPVNWDDPYYQFPPTDEDWIDFEPTDEEIFLEEDTTWWDSETDYYWDCA